MANDELLNVNVWQNAQKLRLIGSGSFGDVYRAKYMGVDVALKLLRRTAKQGSKEELQELAAIKYELANVGPMMKVPEHTNLVKIL